MMRLEQIRRQPQYTARTAMNDTGRSDGKEDAVALLHEDRLFPADETTRAIARRLYEGIKDLPIVSPHGHTQARMVCAQ